LWLTADGRIRPFAGDMDDYARFILERAKLAASLSPEVDLAPSGPIPGDQDGTAAARLAARKAAKKRRRRGL